MNRDTQGTRTPEEWLDAEKAAAHAFRTFLLSDPDLTAEVYPGWSARDVLAHLVFWHQSCARNVTSLAEGRKPPVLRGRLLDLNQQGVDDKRKDSPATLLDDFSVAQDAIERYILRCEIIPYRVGSRTMTPSRHLEILEGHILRHLKDIRTVIARSAHDSPR